VLEHRWYLSERRGRDVGLSSSLESYVRGVLPLKPDEAAILGVDTREFPVIADDIDIAGDTDGDSHDAALT